MDTTADWVMPFCGLDYGDETVTVILSNPFNNRIQFENRNDCLQMSLAHEFTRNQTVKEFGLRIRTGGPSPIEPARRYRRWLQDTGRFVGMNEKIRRTPEAAKLAGAAHIYLWGDALLAADNVRDWKGFITRLHEHGAVAEPSPGKHIWSKLSADGRQAVATLRGSKWMDRYNQGLVSEALSALLEQPKFYDESSWRGLELDEPTSSLLNKPAAELSTADLCRRNGGLLASAFKPFLDPWENWGDGISPKMIENLAGAGFDRLWLGAEGWAGFVKRPETVTAARKAGYLIATYDSYQSIHRPGEPDTWPTAQFDAALFASGAVVQADGTKRSGFKHKGYLLSPKAARPYVEKRVSGLMKIFPANSWFLDCDGFGQYFDDYSVEHPATQQSDLQERIARVAWIRDAYGAVVGSEGCSAGIASALHFAHGVLTPSIGWGDKDLNDRKSPYDLGGYYPPNGPAAFFKESRLKEEYRSIYYDPRFRLPLFHTVFHDAVIATHHWGTPSLKFPEVAATVELLELLYNVPPLYHLNRQEFQNRKVQIMKFYDVFSPLHRELAWLPLTDFLWLSDDGLVQRTVFGNQVELTANFGNEAYEKEGLSMPPHSLAASWREGGKRLVYPR